MQHDLIAKRIRENLLAQKKRLTEYLSVLNCESKDISDKDADKLQNHIRLESNIISELNSFKKILEPLEIMYRQSPYKKNDSLDDLKEGIMKITAKVQEKSKENQQMLDNMLQEMKNQTNVLPKRNITKDSYTKSESRFIDISL